MSKDRESGFTHASPGVRVEDGTPPAGVAPSTREVLLVLWAHQHQALVRSEVYRRLSPINRPTLGRIGQILAELSKDGLLDCVYGKAQGSRSAAFYVLSSRGRELCRSLGIGRSKRELFPMSTGMLETYLTPDRIVQNSARPGRIVAFHASRGGVGCSTAITFGAHQLATKSTSFDQRLLVADFDFDSPGLDDFFSPDDTKKCRGLRGLIVDYYCLHRKERAEWLRHALIQPRYVLRASPDVNNLLYLPSGFTHATFTSDHGERSEALARLREEGIIRSDRRNNPNNESADVGLFLKDLRSAILDNYDRSLIDTQNGTSLGAWAAICTLADELIVCPRISQTSAHGLKIVLSSFLRKQEEMGNRHASIAFLFAPTNSLTNQQDRDSWIRHHIISARGAHRPGQRYRSASIGFDRRIAQGLLDWKNTTAYQEFFEILDSSINTERSETAATDEIPLSLRLVLEELSLKLEDRDNRRRLVLQASVANSLSPLFANPMGRSKLSKLKSSLMKMGIDEEIIELAQATQTATSKPGIKIVS